MSSRKQIAVIGAGAVGLSTALCILEQFPDLVDVTVIADGFYKDTVSYVAAGFYELGPDIGLPLATLRKWGKEGYDHFMALLLSKDADKSGIQWVSGYHLSAISKECASNIVSAELLPGYRNLTAKELKMFPPEVKYGTTFSTFVIDVRRYLPWLIEQIEKRGGTIEKRTINNLSELQDRYDIIVNCTGLRASKLVEDTHLVPVRGQVLKVKAPWVKHFYMCDTAYILPGIDYITLGGCREYANYDTKPDPKMTQEIWEKCIRIVPSLEHAELEGEWVGLRPFRHQIRVEKETLQLPNGPLKVVHNYGHGGHGITLSWGTAREASRFVGEILAGDKTSRL